MSSSVRLGLLYGCFFLSGLAGLIYQTAWLQQFAVVFGATELALATVLAAYMAGLALGASLAGRWAHRPRHPVFVYAILELAIGVSALLVPAAIEQARRLQWILFGGAEVSGASSMALFHLLTSFTILLVPTALMGATLPLLAGHAVRSPADISRKIGALYTANVAGAAAGTLSAAFLLLPYWGLERTVLTGVVINLVVFVLAALLARGQAESSPAFETTVATSDHDGSRGAKSWILPLMLVSGGVSFTWEVLWTRLLSQLLGGSIYAFATMLATFLIGLALGAALASRLASNPERARRGFVVAQLAVALLSLTAFAMVERLPALARRVATGDYPLAAGGVLAAITLLPAALAIGATFPCAVTILAERPADAAHASGRVFAWNTLGAIFGALAAGYLLLPKLGFANTAGVAAATSLLLAVAAALSKPHLRSAVAIAVARLAVLAVWPPSPPNTVLRHGGLTHAAIPGPRAFYAVGRSATVQLFEQRAGWRLTTNGLPESMIEPQGRRIGGSFVARWLSLLSTAARPDARALLVVGLGGGTTIEDLPSSLDEIHVVELEPEVVRANRAVALMRRSNPLADPRLHLHINDARSFLALTERRFDAIVSQPSHPWTSGASHLFTRDFLALVRERLTPSGVFVQWMGLPFVDRELLRSMLATAADVFPHVEVYRPGPGAILVLASPAPLDLVATAPEAISAAPAEWAQLGVLCRDDVVAARVLDTAGVRRLSDGARISSDAFNLFQTRGPRVLGKALDAEQFQHLVATHDALAHLPPDIDSGYVARRLIRQGAPIRARSFAESLPTGRHGKAQWAGPLRHRKLVSLPSGKPWQSPLMTRTPSRAY